MLTLLSPAKTLDLSPAPKGLRASQPRFKRDIAILRKRCSELDATALAKLMKLSDSLAELNHQRFQAMGPSFTKKNSKACLFAFQGDVYRRLDAASLTESELLWAQDRLRIISGLYGLLRPLDLIQPYRLEMGTRLDTERGETLYEFWGTRLADALNKEQRKRPTAAILNLASDEYAKAVPADRLDVPMITAHFQEIRDGKLKTIGFSAKKARGMMARYVIQNRVEDLKGLEGFSDEGYAFRRDLSSAEAMFFVRDRPAA
jgi:cytoplasmic iron level regulating protein YaaA (DUF328/UPF0246 family)